MQSTSKVPAKSNPAAFCAASTCAFTVSVCCASAPRLTDASTIVAANNDVFFIINSPCCGDRRLMIAPTLIRRPPSHQMLLGLDQSSDVTELEGEILPGAPLLIAGNPRSMIGHQQILIARFAIDFQHLDEIHIAFVRKHLRDEIIAAAANVTEMNIENLLAAAEPADHLGQFIIGVIEVLGNRALAEIQAMVGAFMHANESLQTIDVA